MRACLPAHVGVIFKWNGALAAPRRRKLGAAGGSWGTRRGPLRGFPGRCSRAIEAVPTAGFQRSPQLRRGSLTVSFTLCPSLKVDYMFPPGNTSFFTLGTAPAFIFREQSHLLLVDLEAVPGQAARPPVAEQISYTHILASTQRPGRRLTLITLRVLCPRSLALNGPSTFVPAHLGLTFLSTHKWAPAPSGYL